MTTPRLPRSRGNFERRLGVRVGALAAFLVFVVVVKHVMYPSKGNSSLNSIGRVEYEALPPSRTAETLDDVAQVSGRDPCHGNKLGFDPGGNLSFPVQFVHIPKAGGTSVQEIFLKAARFKKLSVLEKDNGGPFWVEKRRAGVYLGHRGFGFSSKLQNRVGEDVLYVVALRDPIKRFVSSFSYRLVSPEPLFREMVEWWGDRDINDVIKEYYEFVKSGGDTHAQETPKQIRTLRRLLHQQIDYVCGFDCVPLFAGDDAEFESDYLNSPAVTLSLEQKFAKASRNLRRADVVVVLDRLDDVVKQMKVNVKWWPATIGKIGETRPQQVKTPSKRSTTLNDESRKILGELLREDSKLYARAVEIGVTKAKNAAACLRKRARRAAGR